MRIRFSKISNNRAAALMMVLIVTMVMAVIGITIFSQSMSQSKTAHSQVDQIVAEQLSKGAFWNFYNTNPPGTLSPVANSSSTTLNGRTYTTTVTYNAATKDTDVQVSY